MRKLILLIFSSFLFSNFCYSQKIEKFQVIDKGENVYDIDFGKKNYLFAVNYNEEVKKINIDSITQSYTFNVNAKCIGISNSTENIAFGTSDGNLLFFSNQEIVKNFKAHHNQITFITFSLSDKYFATSSIDSTIKIWSAKTYDLLQEIYTKSDLVTDIKFSLEDEFLVFSTNTGKVSIWSINKNELSKTYQISKNWIRSIAICPDSTRFAVCGDDKKIRILSLRNKDYYQLEKSHRNIIPRVQFINKDYLISIGHDNRIVMNNINIPTEKSELKHFNGYPRYKGYFYDLAGDKYLSDLSISNENKIVAISSYGKGIALTNYFHNLIENPHEIKIKEIDNSMVDTVNVESEFLVTKKACIITGRITRPEEIKNAWLYFVDDDKKVKLKYSKKGEFQIQVPILTEMYDFTIIVEDWDKYLNTVKYNFRLIRSN